MAANKFATMLHKNCHKIVVILVYTFLEWILILLLLLNSSFSYLIRKFANFFGLRQSCTWCSTLDHIFDSKKTTNSQLDHVCEAHGAEISKLSYCNGHKRLAESNNLCADCSSSTLLDCGAINDVSAFFTWMSEEKRCSCCDEILSGKVYRFKPSWDVLDYVHKKGLSSEPDLMKDKERGDDDDDDDHMGFDKECDAGEKTEENVEEFECDDPFLNRSNEDDESVYLADMLLKNGDYTDSDRFICIELIEDEKRDDEDGEEAEDFPGEDDCVDEYPSREDLMARIKGVYQELEEERRAAEEATKETMAMITKLQEEKAAIQMEAIQYQRMMEEQAEYDQEALQLLNDLMTKRDKEKKELERELQVYRSKGLQCENEDDDSQLDDSMEDLGGENVSLGEFDDERVSILEEVKNLEAKLLALHDEEMKISRNDVMTKKLLPLFDANENENENEFDGIGVVEELGRVYERLQALEEDNDFLKHCIGSMMKGGNKGLILVQEILQHLRDLKSVELSERKMDDIALYDASPAIKED